MKTLIQSLTLSIALIATSLAAQSPDNGQFDLSGLSGDLSPKININFGPAMMSGFSESMASSNPDLSSILGGVTGLRLMIFEDVETSGLEPGITSAVDRLTAAGWNQAVQIREDDTLIDLFMMETPDYVKGLVLLLRDDGDTLILANVHGDLNPAAVGRLVASGNAFNGWNFDFSDGEMSIDTDG